MNSTNLKTVLAKVFTVGLVAAVVAAPSKAEAQVSLGIRVGGPMYVAPGYGQPVYAAPSYAYGTGYAPGYAYGYSGRDYDREAWARHENWNRHEDREHRGRFEREEERHGEGWRR